MDASVFKDRLIIALDEAISANKDQIAGFRSVQWNATNNLGQPVPAGMYIYTIQAGEFRQTRKMVLLK